jgi:hypothetical protein
VSKSHDMYDITNTFNLAIGLIVNHFQKQMDGNIVHVNKFVLDK